MSEEFLDTVGMDKESARMQYSMQQALLHTFSSSLYLLTAKFFETMAKVILVTGGTGLVGNGIKASVERDGPVAGEEFIFLSSKDCNLL